MKKEELKFIKNAVTIGIIFIILLLLLNQAYIQFVFKQKNIDKDYEQLKEINKNELQVIFMGDSHVARGINPIYINNSFNFAVPSETTEQTFYKTRWILKEYPNIEIFVFPYDPHMFWSYRSNEYHDRIFWINFLSYEELMQVTNTSKVKTYMLTNFPVISNGEEALELLLYHEDKTEMYLGWQKITNNSVEGKDVLTKARRRVQGQTKNGNERNMRLFTSFLQTIRLLEQNNKTVILIKFPLTEEYLEAVEETGMSITNFYKEESYLLEKFPNLYILDHQNIYKENKSLFSDSDHLNIQGAELFSKKINEDLYVIREK